jgi:hypothetical protein
MATMMHHWITDWRPTIPDDVEPCVAEILKKSWAMESGARPSFRKIRAVFEDHDWRLLPDVNYEAVREYVISVQCARETTMPHERPFRKQAEQQGITSVRF